MSPIFITQFMQINGNIQGITAMKLVIGCADIAQRKLFLIAANRYPLNQQDKIKICGYQSDTSFLLQFMQINGNIQGITFMKLVIGCAEIEQRKLFLIAAHRYPLNQQDKIKICGYRSDTSVRMI